MSGTHTDADDDEELWSVAELSTNFRMSKTVIYAHCAPDAAEHWEHQRIGGRIKFTRAQRNKILADTLQAAPPAAEVAAPVVDKRSLDRAFRRLEPAPRNARAA